MTDTKISLTATDSELACYINARMEFDRYASCGGDPEAEGLSEMACLQIRLMRWERHSFGLQPAYTSALGIIEEFGELAEAPTPAPPERMIGSEEWMDAIGDILVFSVNLCTKNRLDFDALLARSEEETPRMMSDALVNLGRLAHVTLKAGQKIRGYDDVEVVRRDTCIVLYRVVSSVVRFAAFKGWSAREILGNVATEVMGRDWSKDKVGGGIKVTQEMIDDMVDFEGFAASADGLGEPAIVGMGSVD